MFQRGYTLGAQADQVRDDIIARIHARGLRPGQRIDEDEIRGRLLAAPDADAAGEADAA